MSEFERLGGSRLWRSAFRLSRILRMILGPAHGEARRAGQDLMALAGQVVFAREEYDRRVYLEEFLAQAQVVEDVMLRLPDSSAMFRAWFRLGQTREEAFFELDRSLAQMQAELLEALRQQKAA